MSTKLIITDYLSQELSGIFEGQACEFWDRLQEIRIRVNKPLIAVTDGKELFFDRRGKGCGMENAYCPTVEDVNKTISLISNFSIYAFEEELRNGYITISGGHRVGISGKAVVEKGFVKTIKNINGLNFRISHEIRGCADSVIEQVVKSAHTMIISPPGCGKTTLLRDIIRQISVRGQAVAVVDERSEIAGCYMGIPQNDLGPRTDVLDGCPKAEGMIMLLRAMSPKIIAVDEIGKEADVRAIDEILCAGVKIICTVHGIDLDDIRNKSYISDLVAKNIFDRFIVLERLGEIKAVYDAEYRRIGGRRL